MDAARMNVARAYCLLAMVISSRIDAQILGRVGGGHEGRRSCCWSR
jgi:hypothetical protein